MARPKDKLDLYTGNKLEYKPSLPDIAEFISGYNILVAKKGGFMTMSSKQTVIGVFESRQQAETAVNQLYQQGFTHEEISIMAKKSEGDGHHSVANDSYRDDTIVDGAATGGTIGGFGGLLAAVGALAIPGFGPIIALGPIAAIISGTVAGGVAGGLIDYGIPAERSKVYETHIHEGKVLAIVRSESANVIKAINIFRGNGAKDVETH
jgi:hypothetical protein